QVGAAAANNHRLMVGGDATEDLRILAGLSRFVHMVWFKQRQRHVGASSSSEMIKEPRFVTRRKSIPSHLIEAQRRREENAFFLLCASVSLWFVAWHATWPLALIGTRRRTSS